MAADERDAAHVAGRRRRQRRVGIRDHERATAAHPRAEVLAASVVESVTGEQRHARVGAGHRFIGTDLRTEALHEQHEPLQPVRRCRGRRQRRAFAGRALPGKDGDDHQRDRDGDADHDRPACRGHGTPASGAVWALDRSRTSAASARNP